MPDVSLVNSTVSAAPKDYVVPGAQELLLKAVRAEIDGSGAASSFLPALQLLDPAGHVMWTANLSSSGSIAAGGSASASWFPGLGGNSGGAATAEWFWATRVTAFSIGSANQLRIPWTHFVTSNSQVFSVTTHTNANDQVNGLADGIYIAQGSLIWTAPQTYPHACEIVTDFFATDAQAATPTSDSNTDVTEEGRSRIVADIKTCVTQSVPGEISLTGINADGVAHNVTSAKYAILYLPNSMLVS